MRGVELKSYDIPHQLSEQLHRDTGVRNGADDTGHRSGGNTGRPNHGERDTNSKTCTHIRTSEN